MKRLRQNVHGVLQKLHALGRPARSFLWDLVALGGLALVGTGLWWIYPPAALIILGLALVGTGLWGAYTWGS